MKPKILFIMHTPPPVHGAAMMGQYIKDSKLINSQFDCIYINPSLSHKVSSVGKVNISKVGKLLGIYWKVLKTVIKEKPDLCYFTATCSGWGIIRDAFMVGLLKIFHRKIVLHLHNKGVRNLRGNKIADIIYRLMFKNVKVILLSEHLYEDVTQFVKHKDVYICPNGIPDTTGGVEPSAERHNKIPHLLFLSNLIISKGVIVLLDALKILKDRGYSFVCDFVGGETKEMDAARFKEEVEKRGLNQLAVYDGRKFGNDKEGYYNKADIFVLPTYYSGECFPLVLLEAMEHGLPCISTNNGGILDIIENGKTGLVAQSEDCVSLADTIQKLFDSPNERVSFGREGFNRYKRLFTQFIFEERITGILENIVNV